MRLVMPAVVVVCLSAGGSGLGPARVPAAWARSKPSAKKPSGAEVGSGSDRTLEKQSAWEQKVMGDDGRKRADMNKIAAAQKLGEETRKNPPPEPAKKYKDPSKEGARAKSEATIGLPIASDQKSPARKATPAPAGKKAARGTPANDELSALVTSSLDEDRKKGAAVVPATNAPGRPGPAPGRGKARGKRGRTSAAAPPAPSSLDRMFSAGGG
jgi:hypothetical protein